jgi:hypothetical protein
MYGTVAGGTYGLGIEGTPGIPKYSVGSPSGVVCPAAATGETGDDDAPAGDVPDSGGSAGAAGRSDAGAADRFFADVSAAYAAAVSPTSFLSARSVTARFSRVS